MLTTSGHDRAGGECQAPRSLRRRLTFLALLSCISLNGCYYLQAARGQIEVLRKREPIPAVLADDATPEGVAERLRLVQEARNFSIAELAMPDNGSYRSYADLGRDFALWSIFAAPELSLDPLTWCYPIVGCVAYRGYFREATARREADDLSARGFDVHVAAVPAYSTLGRFDDPVLNTMLRWDDLQLVSTVFHELAHQVLYIADDTGFNESFATAVEEIGLERFLRARESGPAFAAYEERRQRRRELMELVNAARADLQIFYNETLDDDEKRLLKENRLERLQSDIAELLGTHGIDSVALLSPWNNAKLLSFNLYEGWLPAFRRVYELCDCEIMCFYDESRRLSELERAERERYLESLASR